MDLAGAVGRVLAAAMTAPEAVPGFLRATMDGYAVAARDTFGASVGTPQYLEIKGEVAMGAAPTRGVGSGEALRVPTGAMLPEGSDAVVMVEYTAEHPDKTLEVRRAVAPGENVLSPGEDVGAGELLFEAGVRLRPQDIGLLAALGITRLTVYQKPRVAILSSGDEIVPLDRRPAPGQVRDSNAYLAAAQVEVWGGIPLIKGIIPDDFAALRAALAAALAEADLILISGGSSVGVRDLTLAAIQDLPGAEILVHGVAIRPGKPTILAAVGERRGAAAYGPAGAPGLRHGGHGGPGTAPIRASGRPQGAGALGPNRHRRPLPQPGRGVRPGGLRPGAPAPGGRHPVGRSGPGTLGAALAPGEERRPGDDPPGGGRAVQGGGGGGAAVWVIVSSEQGAVSREQGAVKT